MSVCDRHRPERALGAAERVSTTSQWCTGKVALSAGPVADGDTVKLILKKKHACHRGHMEEQDQIQVTAEERSLPNQDVKNLSQNSAPSGVQQ